MKKKSNNNHQSSLIEEWVKERPILTEEEMNSFMTYDEIISEAKRLFDEAVKKIWQEHDSHTTEK